jgi:hypothetical protein
MGLRHDRLIPCSVRKAFEEPDKKLPVSVARPSPSVSVITVVGIPRLGYKVKQHIVNKGKGEQPQLCCQIIFYIHRCL